MKQKLKINLEAIKEAYTNAVELTVNKTTVMNNSIFIDVVPYKDIDGMTKTLHIYRNDILVSGNGGKIAVVQKHSLLDYVMFVEESYMELSSNAKAFVVLHEIGHIVNRHLDIITASTKNKFKYDISTLKVNSSVLPGLCILVSFSTFLMNCAVFVLIHECVHTVLINLYLCSCSVSINLGMHPPFGVYRNAPYKSVSQCARLCYHWEKKKH